MSNPDEDNLVVIKFPVGSKIVKLVVDLDPKLVASLSVSEMVKSLMIREHIPLHLETSLGSALTVLLRELSRSSSSRSFDLSDTTTNSQAIRTWSKRFDAQNAIHTLMNSYSSISQLEREVSRVSFASAYHWLLNSPSLTDSSLYTSILEYEHKTATELNSLFISRKTALTKLETAATKELETAKRSQEVRAMRRSQQLANFGTQLHASRDDIMRSKSLVEQAGSSAQLEQLAERQKKEYHQAASKWDLDINNLKTRQKTSFVEFILDLFQREYKQVQAQKEAEEQLLIEQEEAEKEAENNVDDVDDDDNNDDDDGGKEGIQEDDENMKKRENQNMKAKKKKNDDEGFVVVGDYDEEASEYRKKKKKEKERAEASRARVLAKQESVSPTYVEPLSKTGIPPPMSSSTKSESFSVSLGAQLKTKFHVQLIAGTVLDFIRFDHSQDQDPLARLTTAKLLYSDTLYGVIMLSEPSLSFKSPLCRKFRNFVLRRPEYHFEELEEQISDALDQPPTSSGNRLETGDVVVTKHSSLSSCHVVFHLIIDDATRASVIAGEQLPERVASGLTSVFHLAAQYDVKSLGLPMLMADPSQLNLASLLEEKSIKRAENLLKLLKTVLLDQSRSGAAMLAHIQLMIPVGAAGSTGSQEAAKLWMRYRSIIQQVLNAGD